MQEYVIKSGDNFYGLAQQNHCSCQQIIDLNPGVDPNQLQIGQKIKIPVIVVKPSGGCAGIPGESFNRCDDVLVDVEGVKFRVTRMGEPATPHELHLILPRTEIRKVEHPGGIIETNIMVSNINIVNSPRFEGEGGDRAKSGQSASNQAAGQGITNLGTNQSFSNQGFSGQAFSNQGFSY